MRVKGNKPYLSRLPGQHVRKKPDRTKWVGDLLTEVTQPKKGAIMNRYVVTTVWVEHRVVEAETLMEAYNNAEPPPRQDLALSNWHVAAIVDNDGGITHEKSGDGIDEPASGGLNYRQVG